MVPPTRSSEQWKLNMSSLIEGARRDFYSILDELKEVHDQEELEIVRDKLKRARKILFEADSDFRASVENRQKGARIRMAEMKQKTDRDMNIINVSLGKRTEKYGIKTREGLICPICHGPDRGNVMNNEPTCMSCMHKLIPREDLKEYNRAYRRNWKRRHS